MIFPAVPYTPEIYRNADAPVRVWYSLGRKRIKELRAALVAIRAKATEPEADAEALEDEFVGLFCEYVDTIEVNAELMEVSRDACEDLSFKFITQALAGVAAELYDADFAKKS